MIKFAIFQDTPLVHLALDRLHEASIPAVLTTECSWEYPVIPVKAVLWIVNPDDCPRAAEVLREFHRSLTTGPYTICPACNYDLRGHEGEVNCPECGRSVLVGPESGTRGLSPLGPFADTPCSHCGEPVPEHFEVCWSCGALRSAS